MADTAAENEADSGSGGPTQEAPDGTQEDDGEQNEAERVTGSNTNYDSSEGTHRCNRCDFEGVSQVALAAHISQAHTTNEVKMESENNNSPPDRIHRKMFECDVCNMKFSNGANMRRHKMRHTGVKPYECRVCQKRFFRKDHLAEHFTTHTKTLPYHCPICNRGFQRQIAMRAHFQNEHVGQHDLVKSCPLCSYRAGSMKSLRVHFFNRSVIFSLFRCFVTVNLQTRDRLGQSRSGGLSGLALRRRRPARFCHGQRFDLFGKPRR
jgi:IKAROS family zinc finger protein